MVILFMTKNRCNLQHVFDEKLKLFKVCPWLKTDQQTACD